MSGAPGVLAEKAYDEEGGKMRWTRERLITARNGPNGIASKNPLLAFLDLELTDGGALPSMNDKIEGGVNAQPRRMPRGRRGLSDMRRAKAVSRRRCMRTEPPLPAAEILKVVPTDADIGEVCRQSVYKPQ